MTAMTRRGFLGNTSGALAAGAMGFNILRSSRAYAANDTIRVAVIGLNGQGNGHLNKFLSLHGKGVEVAALCDVDEQVLATRGAEAEKATGSRPRACFDMRELFDDDSIHAVSIATPNHWHALATIWACQAGKDVYVEKPCCHNVWEGRQMVKAAEKYQRAVQVGTQRRSDEAWRNAVGRLHAGQIGDLYMARGLCYKQRNSIGIKPDGDPPANLHWDLWLGPAPQQSFNPNYVHYNWHWFWDFGNGDMGNQGVHQMDVALWGLGKSELPVLATGIGGRYTYQDQGQTPNTQVCTYRYADGDMLVFETRGRMTNDEAGESIGNLFYGSNGYMTGQTARCGSDGQPCPAFEGELPPAGGNGQGDNFDNWLGVVRSRKMEDLNAPILQGYYGAALCHLGNIAYRLQREVRFDPQTETCPDDPEANAMLTREYRAPFVVPKEV